MPLAWLLALSVVSPLTEPGPDRLPRLVYPCEETRETSSAPQPSIFEWSITDVGHEHGAPPPFKVTVRADGTVSVEQRDFFQRIVDCHRVVGQEHIERFMEAIVASGVCMLLSVDHGPTTLRHTVKVDFGSRLSCTRTLEASVWRGSSAGLRVRWAMEDLVTVMCASHCLGFEYFFQKDFLPSVYAAPTAQVECVFEPNFRLGPSPVTFEWTMRDRPFEDYPPLMVAVRDDRTVEFTFINRRGRRITCARTMSDDVVTAFEREIAASQVCSSKNSDPDHTDRGHHVKVRFGSRPCDRNITELAWDGSFIGLKVSAALEHLLRETCDSRCGPAFPPYERFWPDLWRGQRAQETP